MSAHDSTSKRYPPSQADVLEAFRQWLNTERHANYQISERPDEVNRNSPDIDYVLHDPTRPPKIAVEVSILTSSLSERERRALQAYRIAPQWRLVAYPPRGADPPLVVEQSLDEAACESLRNLYLRKALDQGNTLPDVRCENTHRW
jgi:hypothetical protein